jgi:hypothetical protein
MTLATTQDEPLFAWTGLGEGELRDVSKPSALDERGNPLYAPRGSDSGSGKESSTRVPRGSALRLCSPRSVAALGCASGFE